MRAGIPVSVLSICLVAVAAARGMAPVPLDRIDLVAGRNILLSVSSDTLGALGESPSVPFVRTRSVVFDKLDPLHAYDEFRMMGMDFSEFTVLRREGDSLFVTAAPKKSRDRASYYPLCIPIRSLKRVYDAKEAPENIRMEAGRRDYSEWRPRVESALAGASLGLLLGTGIGMQLAQARNDPFDAGFRRTFVYGGLGALLGLALVVQISDL